ncbi:MAG: type 4a pilus biogenesis protein PilO [Actinomycetota bacterium]
MTNRRPLFVGIGAVVVALLVFMVLVKPKMAQVGDLKTQVTEATAQTQQLQAQVAELREAKDQAPTTARQLAELNDQVPETADEPGFLRRLKRAADRSAVDLISIAPSQPSATGPYSTIPVELQVKGSYFALEEYLFRLETFARAAKMSSLIVSTGSLPQLQATITANFFTIDTSAGPGSEPGSQSVAG